MNIQPMLKQIEDGEVKPFTRVRASVSDGILVVKHSWGGGWVEASCFVDGTAAEICIDADCAPPAEVNEALRELVGLLEWIGCPWNRVACSCTPERKEI